MFHINAGAEKTARRGDGGVVGEGGGLGRFASLSFRGKPSPLGQECRSVGWWEIALSGAVVFTLPS